MTDVLTEKQRSYCMSRICGKNTKPEILLRKVLYKSGARGYRLHCKLPGKPDIVFTKRKIAVFIDGCFWHKCPKCFTNPKTNRVFWKKKTDSNVKRDKSVNQELKKNGWKVVRVWEHSLEKDINKCCTRILSAFSKTEGRRQCVKWQKT